MTNLLIVENVEDVHNMLVELFISEGFTIFSAFDGLQASKLFKQHPIDIVLLDIMLPYKSGDELVKEFRQTSNVPIMMLSAKDLASTKIDLLRLGADDYLTKPFDVGEVLVRVETLLRRSKPQQPVQTLQYGVVTMDDISKRVLIEQQEIMLTAKEYALLKVMLEHPEKVFTKANLYETVWGDPYFGDDASIKTHMSNIRIKLKNASPQADLIEILRGIGYRLKKST